VKLTAEEISSKLLLDTDNKGRTVLYVAANGGRLELLQEILCWAEENLITEEIKKKNMLLLATDLENTGFARRKTNSQGDKK